MQSRVLSLQTRSIGSVDWIRKCASCKHMAVLDSSFNPPTRAHVQMILQAVQYLAHSDDRASGILLHSVWNADKKIHVGAQIEQRIEMVAKIKALGEFGFAMINRALFVEKAQILKEDLGQDTVLYFIVGTDTLVRILDPKYYPKEGIQVALENLFGKAELICFNRMGFEEKDLVDRIASSGFGEKIHLLSLQDSSLELISSSQARELFHAGNISELSRILPDEVIEYCQSHNIYQ